MDSSAERMAHGAPVRPVIQALFRLRPPRTAAGSCTRRYLASPKGMGYETRITRRRLVGGAAAMGLSSALATSQLSRLASALASSGTTPLPSPAQVRADFQRMVDFGPRLTGSDSHNRYVEWLEQEFVNAGLQLIPCDVYQTERWSAQRVGLDLLDGSPAGTVKV